MADSHSLDALTEALRRLPGVGAKSAARMAFHLLQHDRAGALQLATTLSQAVDQVRHCELCHTFTESLVCSTCQDPTRDRSKLCVVETPADTDLSQAVKQNEHQIILAALAATRSKNEAAERLGISPRTLRYKMARLRENGLSLALAKAS